ncbi:hypothetical protein SUGI_1064210 [Cryptomeria japonica]|nr:hypothetical protein SUGI_1064210 [Cryptomeria japonica]
MDGFGGNLVFWGLSKGYLLCPSALSPVPTKSSKGVDTSLWQEDLECLKWLQTKALSFVMYFSFGSIVVMSMEQLQELALGLEWRFKMAAGFGRSVVGAVLPCA